MDKNFSRLDMHFSGFCEPQITPTFLTIQKNMLTPDSIFYILRKADQIHVIFKMKK